LIDEPFDGDDWLFEIKWDGYRAICTVDAKGKLTLVSRNGLDLLKQFPDLDGLADAFESVPIIVDGEIVSLDSKGRSDFQRLQEYAEQGHSLTYAAFDVLYADGRDQRKNPLEERKALLERLIADDQLVLYSKHVVGKGKALFAEAKRNHLEGIIGKKRASTYQGRRTRDWVKIKAQLEQEFVIGGWTDPRGSRKGFGSLLLGVYEGKDGTGFSVKRIGEIMKQLKPLARETSPFANKVIANAPVHYVQPQLVAEVRFTEWTRDNILRQPAFLGLRIDKAAKDVVRE
jgi:bifunctional non-homologous end joining protein LigD